MTINQLHKITSKLIEQGAGRRGVCVSKDTFRNALESDGATIMTVEKADLAVFPIIDDDGGTAFDSRGREKQSMALVMEGGERGEILRGAGWIDCAERVPGHLHSVLGWVTSGPLVVMGDAFADVVSYDPEGKVWLQSIGTEDARVSVSHWLPLPYPPIKRRR